MRYKKFDSIHIDRTQVAQSDLNIDNKNQTNLFQWNGQFSPQFVETILKKYAKSNYKVIDPFLGSGTTVIEACKLGLDVTGVELNPAAYKISKIYELCNMTVSERENILHYIDNNFILDKKVEINLIEQDSINNILTVFYMLCEKKELTIEKWEKLKMTILNLPVSDNKISIINDDSRYTKKIGNGYDILFTSPPYINVFNYHQQYRVSMEDIGYNILSIAKAEIGSNRKNRSNRFYSVVQYCIDITLVICNYIEAMNDDARMIFVVGRCSNVLGISFSNSRIIYEILVRIFKCRLLVRQERYFKNKYGKEIYEDILHFAVSKKYIKKDNKYYIDFARKIAAEYLEEKLNEVQKGDSNYFLLRDAYESVFRIKES